MAKRYAMIKVILFITLLCPLFCERNVYASYARVTAEFKWDQMEIQGDIRWITDESSLPLYSYVYAYALNDDDSSRNNKEQYDWNHLELSASVSQAVAKAETGSPILSFSSAGPSGHVRPYSESVVRKGGFFEYTGNQPGQVTLSIPYAFLMYLISDQTGYAKGSIYASIYLSNVNSNEGTEWKYTLEYAVAQGYNYPNTLSDTILLQLSFNTGDIGSLWIEAGTMAYAEGSTVPLPGTLIFFTTGIAGLLGSKRLKSRRMK